MYTGRRAASNRTLVFILRGINENGTAKWSLENPARFAPNTVHERLIILNAQHAGGTTQRAMQAKEQRVPAAAAPARDDPQGRAIIRARSAQSSNRNRRRPRPAERLLPVYEKKRTLFSTNSGKMRRSKPSGTPARLVGQV